jgi:nucleotide-binding universal stress UspA family protein
VAMAVVLLRILLFVPIVVGLLGLVVISIRDWDDWVFLGVLAMGVVGLLMTLDDSRYPAPWKKRGFKRDSGPELGSAPLEEGAGKSMLATVAVGTDGSETASRAVDVALDLAQRYGARLVVGSSYRPVAETRLRAEQEEAPEDIQWSINPAEDVDAILRSVEDRARERGVKISSDARMGRPAEVLCEIAAEHEADVLVVGSKGMQRRLLGSVPNTVSHSAPCSVMIVKTA